MPIITTDKVMRPRSRDDYYPTPEGLVEAILKPLQPMQPMIILDPGAGRGVWGKVARRLWPEAHIDGVDLRGCTGMLYRRVYNRWYEDDFLTWQPNPYTAQFYDLIIGNPPYKFAEQFVRRSLQMINRDHGRVVFLLRLAFLESQTRAEGLWQEHCPLNVDVLGKRPSFTGNGRTDATAYAVYHWLPVSWHAPHLGWKDWNYNEADLRLAAVRRATETADEAGWKWSRLMHSGLGA